MKPDERQQSEFLQMLSQCEGILIKACLYFTDRRRDDFRDLYQEIVCTLWESWTPSANIYTLFIFLPIRTSSYV